MLHNIFQDTIKTIRLDSNGFSHYTDGTYCDFDNSTDQDWLVVIANQPPVAIPMEIYNIERNKEYLRIQYEESEIGQIVTTDFKDYVLLNFIPQNEIHHLESLSNPIHYIPLFLYQMAHLFPIPEMLFLLDVKDQNMNCALLIHEELQFITHFKLHDHTDCLYHVMNICAQYNIDPSLIDLHYSAMPESLATLLKTYFTISHLEKPLFNQNLL